MTSSTGTTPPSMVPKVPKEESKPLQSEFIGLMGVFAMASILVLVILLPMPIFLRLLSFITLILLGLSSYKRIPPATYGVVNRMGRRLTKGQGGILLEGGHWLRPLIDRVELISTELDRIEINVSFTTKDNVTIKVNGPLQYRPDSEITNNQGQNLFIEISEETMCKGIAEEVQAKLGALGGVYEAQVFIKNRQAFGALINTMLRFETPPHRNHPFLAGKDNESDPTTGLRPCGSNDKGKKCPFEGKKEISAKDLIRFYNTHWQWVKNQTDSVRASGELSVIEKRFGIEVAVFNLADVAFGKEMEKALEERKQADLRAGAIKKKIDLAEEVKNRLGADAQVALNSADVLMTPGVSKHIVSVEGDAGILGGIVAGLTGKKGAP